MSGLTIPTWSAGVGVVFAAVAGSVVLPLQALSALSSMRSGGGDAHTDSLMMVVLWLHVFTLKSVHVVAKHQTLRRHKQGFTVELDAPSIDHREESVACDLAVASEMVADLLRRAAQW